MARLEAFALPAFGRAPRDISECRCAPGPRDKRARLFKAAFQFCKACLQSLPASLSASCLSRQQRLHRPSSSCEHLARGSKQEQKQLLRGAFAHLAAKPLQDSMKGALSLHWQSSKALSRMAKRWKHGER